MNDDVVARIKSIAPNTWLRIEYINSRGEVSNMDQGWLKTVDFDEGTLTLKSDYITTTVWINNIKSADSIKDNVTGTGTAGPAVEENKSWRWIGDGWKKD
jgi:hypothetical protein